MALIELLFIIIAALALFHDLDERYAILCFVGCCAAFNAFEEKITIDYMYYLGAAFTDLVIIHLLSRVLVVSDLVVNLQRIALFFAIANMYGWIIYEGRSSPDIYDIMCGGLFVSVAIVSIPKGKSNGLGNGADSGNYNIFCSNYCASLFKMSKD